MILDDPEDSGMFQKDPEDSRMIQNTQEMFQNDSEYSRNVFE